MLSENRESKKIVFISYIIVFAFLIILLRLWQLQILQGEDFRKTSESNRLRVIGIPAPRGIIFDRNNIPLVKNTPYFCASLIPEEFEARNIGRLSMLLGLPAVEISGKMAKGSKNPLAPIKLKEGLTFEEVSFIEARRSDFPGLMIEVETTRNYLYGSTGSHIIGYLGKLSPGQSQSPEFDDVPPNAFIGQWGVEKLFDKSLRGTAGQRIIEVDALGKELRLLREIPPVKGSDLALSIDIALQRKAEEAFEGRAGALVALQPETGEVLGLVSSPSFDPNKFAKGISYDDWVSLSRDEKLPMLNRAVQSQYPPGSTFKIITAIAALDKGVMDEHTSVDCRGGIRYGKWHFGCWKKSGHNVVSVHRALVESCDVFFYEAGKRLGIDAIYDYASRFGLGKATGILLGSEKEGLIPNTGWKREKKKEPWYIGETFVNSIGQGYVSVTPLQLAEMTSAVVNGGTVYKPLILKDAESVPLSKAGVGQETLEKMRHYLADVVNEPNGTGWVAKSNVTTIGGKTGTAQVVGIRKDSRDLPEKFRDHAWFVAFAPIERPDIALSVLVEHGGHGGSVAAPIAKKAIEAYMLPIEKKKELLDVQD
jgi:penicillin-binding protein 2